MPWAETCWNQCQAYVEPAGREACIYLRFRVSVIGDRVGMNCFRNKLLIPLIVYYVSAVWRTRCPCPCFVFLSGLSCTTYICIWLPFLPYAYYMWLSWFVLFLFLGFSPPESLPGDDILCRLLPRPLPSVCFLFFSFPTVFVPNLFWCNFLYLVTTAGFVADQLM